MMSEAERKALEKKYGRPITDREVLLGRRHREPERGPRPVQVQTTAEAERSMLLDHVAKAQKAADEEAFRSLPPAQQKLEIAKQVVRDAMGARSRYEAMKAAEAKLQNPDHATKAELDRLAALQEAVAFDPNWSYEQFAQFDEARRALAEQPLADAKKVVDAIFSLKQQKDRADGKGKREQAAALEQQLAALRQDADRLDPPQQSRPSVTAKTPQDIDALWSKHKELEAAGSADAATALADWSSAVDAFGGIAAVRAAEAAPAQGGAS